MRVIECNECGEPQQAASDEELVRNLRAHLQTEHDIAASEEELSRLVSAQAYEATDS